VLGTTLDIAESDYGSQSDTQQSDDSDSDEASEANEYLIQKELCEYLGWLLEWTITAQKFPTLDTSKISNLTEF